MECPQWQNYIEPKAWTSTYQGSACDCQLWRFSLPATETSAQPLRWLFFEKTNQHIMTTLLHEAPFILEGPAVHPLKNSIFYVLTSGTWGPSKGQLCPQDSDRLAETFVDLHCSLRLLPSPSPSFLPSFYMHQPTGSHHTLLLSPLHPSQIYVQ